MFNCDLRYFSTRRLFKGWMSQAMLSASARTHARAALDGRQQRRLRVGLIQVLNDGQRLRDAQCSIHQQRHQLGGIAARMLPASVAGHRRAADASGSTRSPAP